MSKPFYTRHTSTRVARSGPLRKPLSARPHATLQGRCSLHPASADNSRVIGTALSPGGPTHCRRRLPPSRGLAAMAAAASTPGALKSALLVIDMQNDFCLPGSVLCVAGAMGCLPKVVEAVDVARSKGVPIIWVIREHDADGMDVELFRQPMFQAGKASTVPGTKGVQLVEPLAAAPGERTLIKKRFSAFFATELDLVLKRMGVQHVVIAGVQTPNCIRGTAWDALALDYPRVTVLADATASRSEAVQAANLEDMRCASVHTPTVAEWAAQL